MFIINSKILVLSSISVLLLLLNSCDSNNGNNDTSGVNLQQKISANQTKMLMSSLNN